jgi:hypothetical protein
VCATVGLSSSSSSKPAPTTFHACMYSCSILVQQLDTSVFSLLFPFLHQRRRDRTTNKAIVPLSILIREIRLAWLHWSFFPEVVLVIK